MSLDLTRNRKATHEHFAVAGSYTDSYIEVQAHSHTSDINEWYVKWVPNNKSASQTITPGTSLASLDADGYQYYGSGPITSQLASNAGGYYIVRFPYYDSSNAYNGGSTSPGLGQPSIGTYWANGGPSGASDLQDMESMLDNIMSGVYGDIVFAIYSFGKIGSDQNLYDFFEGPLRSWRFTRHIGNSMSKEFSYAAVGTNVNDIGLIAESLQGPKSGHPNAAIELAIEHDRNTLGHAGYGEDLSSGIGAGLKTGETSNTQTTQERLVNWDQNGHELVMPNEYLRISFMGRLNHWSGDGTNSGYYGVQLEDGANGSTYSYLFGTGNRAGIDCFEKHEILHKRTSSSVAGSQLRIKAIQYPGSGSGSGTGSGTANPNHLGAYMRGLEVYKVGFNPDQDRDAAVHKWHINGLNVNEGPADWDPGKAEDFESFWNTDRNLLDTSQTYSTNAFNGTGQSSLNHISSPNSGGIWESINHVNWRGTNFYSTNVNNNTHWAYEYRNTPANFTNDKLLYGSSNQYGIPVDDSKIYMFGVWVRVRQHQSSLNPATAPNRISLTAKAVASNGISAKYLKDYNNANITDIDNHYLSSVNLGMFANQNWPTQQKMEWKLQTGFILPEWMTTTEVDNFYQSYWGLWAGEYEWGNGTNLSAQIVSTSNGIKSAKDGRVAKMTSGTSYIKPNVRVEQYAGTTIWAEFAYPFMLEIDPMNIREGGDVWFWDFDENTNNFKIP